MSDHVHPSEEGYHLMATGWLRAISPLKPSNIESHKSSRNSVKINWVNHELDTDYWLISYRVEKGDKNRTIKIEAPSMSADILTPSPYSPLGYTISFKITAVDEDSNLSPESEVFVIRSGD